MIKSIKRLLKKEYNSDYLKSEKSNVTEEIIHQKENNEQNKNESNSETVLLFEEEFWENLIQNIGAGINIKDKLMCEEDVWMNIGEVKVDGPSGEERSVRSTMRIDILAEVGPKEGLDSIEEISEYYILPAWRRKRKMISSSFNYWEISWSGKDSEKTGQIWYPFWGFMNNYSRGSSPGKSKMDPEDIKREFKKALYTIGHHLWGW
jgi:hypothetical protein